MKAQWYQSWPNPIPPNRAHCIITDLPKIVTDGHDYGHAIHNALADATGLFMVEWDIALDPLDMQALEHAAALQPNDVHVGAYRLWFGHHWCWPHRYDNGSKWVQSLAQEPDAVSWGIIYFPAWLLHKAKATGYLDKMVYPGNDTAFSTFCREVGVPMHIVAECMGTHLHWTLESLEVGQQL